MFFTCGVYVLWLTTESPIENMEMVVSSVEMRKLSATDKELPIQFLQFKMKVCGLVLSLALLLLTPEFARGGMISFNSVTIAHVHYSLCCQQEWWRSLPHQWQQFARKEISWS